MDADSYDRSQRGVCISNAFVHSQGFWIGFGTITMLLVLALIGLQFLDKAGNANSQMAWLRTEATKEIELNLIDYYQAVRTHAQEGGQESQLVAANASAALEKYLEEYNGYARTEKQRQLAVRFTKLWRELKAHALVLLINQNPPPHLETLAKLETLHLGLSDFLDRQMQADAVAERKAQSQSVIPYVRTALNFSLFALILFAGLIVIMNIIGGNVLGSANQIQGGMKHQRGTDRYRALTRLLPQIVWTARADGVFTFCNQNWFTYTGLNADESRGLGWTMAIDPDFRQEALTTWAEIRAKGCEFALEIPMRRADGMNRWHLIRGSPQLNQEGKVTKWVGVAIDIQDHRQNKQIEEYRRQLEEANTRLERLSTTDELTRLKNRRIFQETLEEEIQWAIRYGTQLSLLLMDVDHFKQFNDSFGRPGGDEMLREVARLLKKSARTTDFVARYGGGEFAILLPGTDQQGALVFAEKVRKAVEVGNWHEREITITIGVATLNPDNSDGNALIEEAEVSLYLGKRSGRNCVYIASGNGTQDYFRRSTSWTKPPNYG